MGYCQGLNRLAAIALLFLDEEDSFWCLVAIVQHLLPQDYYSRTLLGSQTDQRVLKDLLQIRATKLSQHLSLCEYVSVVSGASQRMLVPSVVLGRSMHHYWSHR